MFHLCIHFSVPYIHSKTAIESSQAYVYHLNINVWVSVLARTKKLAQIHQTFQSVSHILTLTWQKEFQLIMQSTSISFKKFTYASFKNTSALILSTSPPGGSRSNFFTPSVSRPVNKQTTNENRSIICQLHIHISNISTTYCKWQKK